MSERRKTGRPEKPDHLKLGKGRFVRFPLEQEAAIEIIRQRIEADCLERREMRTVEMSEAIRYLVQRGAEADGLIDVPAAPPKAPRAPRKR